MERALDVMRASVTENRADGKIPPKVGAVLVLPDGEVITACRGELRDGDHAEYTVLERKCRDRRLDGARLFVTLEPCGPDARKPPKLPCAERVLLARIREVWIGIEDPHPSVDGTGIRFLADNGVKVTMFDKDLQDRIREENAEFLDQALQRPEAEFEPSLVMPGPDALDASTSLALSQLSPSALERYRMSIEARRG